MIKILLDSGASGSIITSELVKNLRIKKDKKKLHGKPCLELLKHMEKVKFNFHFQN